MAPYRHYRDKDALLGAVADFGFDKLRAVLLKADQETDPSAALVAQGRAYIAFARAHPQLFRLMFAGHGAGPPPVDDNAYGVLVRRIAELSPGNLEAATLACWSVVHGIATLAVGGTLERQESNLEIEALEMVVRGIQTAPNPT
ncbi:TetR-like C-terminal domain-containing protein [Sphingomonas sp. ASV193]|uniref:TetR-like C-terminal domain-containing protein n=1 Tax=Sphingomonas sp. ASV193 TaxID=3144405 RepID=UPI0032E8799E